MLFGYIAELKLKELLEAHEHISQTTKHDDHDRSRKSDRVILYKNEEFSVESKSLQTKSIKKVENAWAGRAQVDASDRRTIRMADGSELNTTLLLRGEFDILAVNCFAFENEWRWIFALNRDLPESKYTKYTPQHRKQLIASLVAVTWPPRQPFVDDPFPLVERLYQERRAR